MATYRFQTTWLLDAPIEAVWDTIVDYQALPGWWKAVDQVSQIESGSPDGTGGVWTIAWKTPLGYSIAFRSTTTRVEEPYLLELEAVGEVEGNGRWELQSTDEGTLVHYFWNVKTTKAWMNLLAVFIRPLMEWNHHVVMEQGGKGIANHLGAKLLRQENKSLV
ncbi:SRPBCC family protein [Nodosilinea sp. LEGE 07088]|uniref:SRPBCC family protein n=1 Tax=Nodosilinea sp. LEGE 07088 TaxID=2777968 RepID=UPI00187E95CA|nr:SRPBCC family protein [Nodosilinea sp. LEGE 07088]MBE9138038.1 SRPBCC family protein [Nodosilinea sp. LEGE 07088]